MGKEKMSTADADDLKQKMQDVRSCMAGEDMDLELVKQKTKDLQEASWKVTQQAYQQASSEESGDDKSKDEGKWKRRRTKASRRRSEDLVDSQRSENQMYSAPSASQLFSFMKLGSFQFGDMGPQHSEDSGGDD